MIEINNAFGDRLWIVEGSNVNFHGFPYPTRSVVIRLDDGGLWIWSPVELTEELRQQIETIGRPSHLVSPNKLHQLFLSAWHAAYPDAALWGPLSTMRKRTDLVFQAALTNDPPRAWQGQIDQCWIRGSFLLDEIVFFHKASQTAILADLSQNFSPQWLRQHWAPWQRYLAGLSNIVEGKGYAPADWRHSFIMRKELRTAKQKILSWDSHRVVMAHGACQSEQGGAFLAQALGWIK